MKTPESHILHLLQEIAKGNRSVTRGDVVTYATLTFGLEGAQVFKQNYCDGTITLPAEELFDKMRSESGIYQDHA